MRTLIRIEPTEGQMVNAYRDDLEAAQLRADDLEREATALRARNTELERRTAERDQLALKPHRDERAHSRKVGITVALSILGAVAILGAAATGDVAHTALFVVLYPWMLIRTWRGSK